MNDNPDLVVALRDLVVQHGLLTVLQTVGASHETTRATSRVA